MPRAVSAAATMCRFQSRKVFGTWAGEELSRKLLEPPKGKGPAVLRRPLVLALVFVPLEEDEIGSIREEDRNIDTDVDLALLALPRRSDPSSPGIFPGLRDADIEIAFTTVRHMCCPFKAASLSVGLRQVHPRPRCSLGQRRGSRGRVQILLRPGRCLTHPDTSQADWGTRGIHASGAHGRRKQGRWDGADRSRDHTRRQLRQLDGTAGVGNDTALCDSCTRWRTTVGKGCKHGLGARSVTAPRRTRRGRVPNQVSALTSRGK